MAAVQARGNRHAGTLSARKFTALSCWYQLFHTGGSATKAEHRAQIC